MANGNGFGRALTLVVTNTTKLAGLVVGTHEAFGSARPAALAVAALMMSGGQLSETLILGLVGRFFGHTPVHTAEHEHDRKPT